MRFLKKRKPLWILLTVLILILLYLCLVCLPYVKQGGVSEAVQNNFHISDYYSDSQGNERVLLLSSNEEALEERIRLISHAQKSIILSTFDFKSDNSGKLMLAALADAADRGVDVRILVDGFSYLAHMAGDEYFMALASMERVSFQVYGPVSLLRPQELMARMHDKYLIADDTTYILGGRNTYDFFLGSETDYINYDWDVLVYCENPSLDSSINQLKAYAESVMALPCSQRKMDSVPSRKEEKVNQRREELRKLYEQRKSSSPQWFETVSYPEVTMPTNRIRLLSNPIEPVLKEPVLFYQLTELMKEAKGKVIFHTPYIICSDYMTERLAEVCRANPVTMMTNSVANNGNPFGAMDYQIHKPELLSTGVRILEYDSGVSYHGKCFTAGDRLSGIGSFNWDMRSAYLDTELMLVIDSQPFCSLLREAMGGYESEALKVVDAENYDLREGQSPQELTGKRKTRVTLLQPLDGLLRFLM